MTRDVNGARVRAGLILIGVIALTAVATFFLDVAIRATAEGEQVTVFATSAPGLRPGSPVWVAGRPVGRVLSIEFLPPGSEDGNVLIRAALDRGVDEVLRSDATAEVRASDLMAPVVVAIDPGSPGAAPRDPDAPLRAATRLDREALLGMADTLLAAGRSLAEQTAVTRAALTDGSGTLQRLRADPAILNELRADFERLRVVLVNDFPASTLGRLASDTLILGATTSLRGRLDELAGSPGRAGAERAAADMSEALAGLQARVAELARRLDEGEGTAGRALVDRELARQIELLRSTMRALADDLARYPGRWLRVRVF